MGGGSAVASRAMELLLITPGAQTAVRATEGLEDADEISGSCAALTAELVSAVERLGSA